MKRLSLRSAIDGRAPATWAKPSRQYSSLGRNVFGWIRAFGRLRQFKLRSMENFSAVFGLDVIAYNLIRLDNLLKPVMEAS